MKWWPSSHAAAVSAQALSRVRLPLSSTTLLCERLALYLGSGISLLVALDLIARDRLGTATGQVLGHLTTEVRTGTSLSVACSHFPRVFPAATIGMLRAGEMSGRLASTLKAVAARLRRRAALRRTLQAAALYPAVILIVTICVGIFLALTALPALIPVLTGMQVELPLPTRVLISTNAWVRSWGLLGISVAAAGIGGAVLCLHRHSAARRALLHTVLRIPILGSVIRDAESGLVLNTLADLLDAGVRIDDSLDLAASAVVHPVFREACAAARKAIHAGNSLHDAFDQSGSVLAASVLGLIQTGERSGTLAHCLRLAGHECEERAQYRMSVGGKAAEPLLLLVLASIVGLFAAAVLMPLYSLTRGINAI